jgi:hypothetical protein
MVGMGCVVRRVANAAGCALLIGLTGGIVVSVILIIVYR